MRKLFCLFIGSVLMKAAFSQVSQNGYSLAFERQTPILSSPPAAESSFQPEPFDRIKLMDYLQGQQFDDAIAYLSPALTTDSNNLSLLSYAGYAYYMAENYDAAKRSYGRVFRLDSTNLSALTYLTILYQHEPPPDTALEYSMRLLSLQPAKSAWWRISGQLFARMAQPDSALSYLQKAYALAPGDNKNSSALAELLIDRKQYLMADSILDAALAKDSVNTALLKMRVRSAFLANDYAGVLVPGERLVRQHDPAVNALSWLSLAYYHLNQYADCIRICEYMLSEGLEIESVYYYEARARAKLKQYALSSELLDVCLSKAISNTADWYYEALAGNDEAVKDYKKAVAHYDTAWYLFRNPLSAYKAGRLCETELKNNSLARKYYLRYLAGADPKTPQEKKAYAYVREQWGRGNKKK